LRRFCEKLADSIAIARLRVALRHFGTPVAFLTEHHGEFALSISLPSVNVVRPRH
jgi:hypothetical protein